ncbi:MAG: sulfatase-modifying factor protein, partial [Caldithrix sp.]|nr:sulfatase-modifying factor protein [Caldithrix sp.]
MAHTLEHIVLSAQKRLQFEQIQTSKGSRLDLHKPLPLFSLQVNDSLLFSSDWRFNDQNRFQWANTLSGKIEVDSTFEEGWKANITFTNEKDTTISIANVVPLGQTGDHIYITASGPWSLARSKIFFPDKGPIGVILPDNAWELGYSDWRLDAENGLCTMTRRIGVREGKAQRWQTVLQPGGQVVYQLYADLYKGRWQEGLRLMFQDRYLYDVKQFDNALFQRSDLQWVRRMYAMVLMYAWDHDFYDTHKRRYTYPAFLDRAEKYLGGWDAFALWPTWPTLGIDQRNQWDLYGDLPGGLSRVREIADDMQNRNTRFFVSYNPWDQSTRYVDPYEGLSDLIRNTNADGVVLDTYGHSSDSLQQAADTVKKGVCMYSEGMAVPKNMQGIISGRVHNAIVMPPPLNLNKLIKPDFTIMRVAQLKDHYLHRELALSFFNGYGTELNVMSP